MEYDASPGPRFDLSDLTFASLWIPLAYLRILAERSKSLTIRYGPEFTIGHFLGWCIEKQIALVHIQPGKPQAERVRGKFQRQVTG
jgi:hypothetical protein